jgi:hypothetical protein
MYIDVQKAAHGSWGSSRAGVLTATTPRKGDL